MSLFAHSSASDKSTVSYRCELGHIVKVTLGTALSTGWAGQCEECVFEDRYERIMIFVNGHHGKLLSKGKQFKSTDKVTIECSSGHQSTKRVYSLLEGTWCAECYFEASRKPRTSRINRSEKSAFDRVKEIAKRHGGRCLSTEYQNSRSHLEWECEKGHRWKGPAQTVLYQDSWCNICALQQRPKGITLEMLQKFARKHDGELLSTGYRRNDEKLEWRCANGHTFKRTWMTMRKGLTFCTQC